MNLTERDEYYMGLALEQAAQAAALGEVPIGAVVVLYDRVDDGKADTSAGEVTGRVVGTGYNRRETDRDPAGHTEFIALEQAARNLDRWRLSDCTVYVTLEPCLMCAGLMYQARIARCVYGASDPKAGALGTLYQVNEDQRLNHVFPVKSGVREQECASLLKDFFAALRAKRKRAGKDPCEGSGDCRVTEGCNV